MLIVLMLMQLVVEKGSDMNCEFDGVEIRCSKNSVISQSITIEVDVESCDHVTAPPGLVRINEDYLDLNDGIHFGQSTHTDVLIRLQTQPVGQYAVVSNFKAPNQIMRRRIDFVSPPTITNPSGFSLITISRCPGDFSVGATCAKVVAPFRSMKFSTHSNDDEMEFCVIEPGETYFMNVVFSQDPFSSAPECHNLSNSECGIFYTEGELN